MVRQANQDAAMDIGGWLRGLGLEQCEAAFHENEIDDTVLPRLTAEDLKELGVGALGHRRKLLDAIAALRAQAHQRRLSRRPSDFAPFLTRDEVNFESVWNSQIPAVLIHHAGCRSSTN